MRYLLCIGFVVIAISAVVILLTKINATEMESKASPTPLHAYELVSKIDNINSNENLLTSEQLGVKIKYPSTAVIKEYPIGYKNKPNDGISLEFGNTKINAIISIDLVKYAETKDLEGIAIEYLNNTKRNNNIQVIKPTNTIWVSERVSYEYGYTRIDNNNPNHTILSYTYLVPEDSTYYYLIQITDYENSDKLNPEVLKVLNSIEFID